jgi:hypothetical protein
VVTLAACGGSNKTAATATASTAAASNATTVASGVATTASTTRPATAAASGTKVNANNATRAELQAAFEAAGVTNAAQWAREVEEYRPYTADDPTWGRLRKELAKYNIASDVLEKIIATLAL